ncbi:MAG TPA: serine/threonine-protein kinase, partial [Polyangiaceae bacterium]
MDVREGQILAGKYRVERVLGVGGMGIVVSAQHLRLDERVAIKLMHQEALANPELVARFAREARAAVRIKSEHVARVSDVGTLESGAPYMVMEYLDGVDLSAWLAQRGALPVEQAVDFILQACEAIAEAHALGIVHRDLKPANLFVIERADGALAVKVLDFGISKTTGPAGSDSMTKTSAAMGSPLYMSPEQMHSAKDVDPRGDIWALGIVLYELVSGCAPFQGETMAALVLKVVSAAPTPLSEVCALAPPGLEAVVLKCLQKDRSARYQSVAELAVALHEFGPRHSKASVERIGRVMQRAGLAPAATELPASAESADTLPSVSAPRTMATWGQTNPPVNRRRRVALIAAALLAVPLSVLGALGLLRSSAHGAALA